MKEKAKELLERKIKNLDSALAHNANHPGEVSVTELARYEGEVNSLLQLLESPYDGWVVRGYLRYFAEEYNRDENTRDEGIEAAKKGFDAWLERL
jgi:hypothetical protein